MAHPSEVTVTQLLHAFQHGDRSVLNDLFARVYAELHARAQRQRANWHGDYTINTTALVHETYLKLVDQSQADWASRTHFMAVAAKAMRHILIDYARQRRAAKRGGHVQKVTLDEMKIGMGAAVVMTTSRADTLLMLEEALKRLERVDAREAQVVECRFFGGMTIKETAQALGISSRSVKRDWALAQAWLHREMGQDGPTPP